MNFLQSPHDRDIELLSAYLDDELSPSERNKLERRLQSDSRLRSSLEGLRRVQTTLAELPRMKPPRSFTLKPGMLGKPQQAATPLIPIFNYATSLAAVLFAVLVGARLATGLPRLAAPAAEVPEQPSAQSTEVAQAFDPSAQAANLAESDRTATAAVGGAPEALTFSADFTEPVQEPLTGGAAVGGGAGGEPGTSGPGLGGGGGGGDVPPALPPDVTAIDSAPADVTLAPATGEELQRDSVTETPSPKQLAPAPEPATAETAQPAAPGLTLALVLVGAALAILIGISILLRRR